LGILCQLTGLYQIDPANGFYSLIPSWSSFDISAIGLTFGKCFDLTGNNIKMIDFIVIMCAFLFVDMFDTLGTLIGVANKADMLDEEGKLPRIKQALLADAIATSVGAILGTSTTTTFVESSSGVAEGGRTGLASIVTGFLFLLAIIFAPVFTTIPSFATAPALIFVGFLMISAVTEIDFNEPTEAIPAYLCLICMPLMYSISEGIAVGIISYVIINLVCGKTKKITPLMYILAVLFVLKYVFL
jgi:AGZA family xanthine/uracil permease-like MFS transporter